MRKDIVIKNLGGIYYMKYKQFIILLFAAILTVILTGCGSTKNKEVTTTINSDTKSQENNVSFAEISKSNIQQPQKIYKTTAKNQKRILLPKMQRLPIPQPKIIHLHHAIH